MDERDRKLSNPSRSILIVRLSAIGDVVMASPVAECLRKAYPGAKIAWLAETSVTDVLVGNPFLDEVIVWDKARWRKLFKAGRLISLFGEIRSFAKELRRKNFDYALDMQGLLKSGALTALSGARTRIGLGSREGSSLFMTKIIARPTSSDRISSQYFHLMKELGMDPGAFPMHVPVSPDDDAFARDFVAAEGLDAGYVAFAPFTTRLQKHWINGRWAELAQRLGRQRNLKVLVLGGPADTEAAQRILSSGEESFVSGVGKTTLRQAAALIRRSRGLVGVDTGLTHMGIGLGVSTVAVFGSTCPYSDTARDNAVVLYSPEPCSPCRRNPTCGGAYQCMQAITTDQVFDTLAKVLDT